MCFKKQISKKKPEIAKGIPDDLFFLCVLCIL